MTNQTNVDGASIQSIVPRPLADKVAEKAKRVFELMESQKGTKSFGSVEGTNILITIHRVENPYANCKSLDEVCKTFIEEDHEMRKFFGKDEAMKTWTLKKNGAQHVVEDENGKLVCARNNQRDAVVSALRIASETKRGAVQVVGE